MKPASAIPGPALAALLLGACAALTACGSGSSSTGGRGPFTGCAGASATVVCTNSGQVQGVVEGAYRAFRGIPFAAPPVGRLRWRPPVAAASWQGIRNATAFGNRCPQTDFNGGMLGDEDCLTLNVYAVNPPAQATQPVMVFFHGGGWRLGSAQDAPFDLIPQLAGNGVTVVTAQYRLGLLGFLAHPCLPWRETARPETMA